MTISRPRRREKKLRRKGNRKRTGQRRKLRRLKKWFKRWQKKSLMLYRNLWVRHWSTLGKIDNGRDIENKWSLTSFHRKKKLTPQNQPNHLLWVTPTNSSQWETLQVKSPILVKQTDWCLFFHWQTIYTSI